MSEERAYRLQGTDLHVYVGRENIRFANKDFDGWVDATCAFKNTTCNEGCIAFRKIRRDDGKYNIACLRLNIDEYICLGVEQSSW